MRKTFRDFPDCLDLLDLFESHCLSRVLAIEFFELSKNFLRFLRQYFRQRNFYLDELIASKTLISQTGKSPFAKPELLA